MNILFATGGSGGHIFPALCVAEILQDENHTITFATASGMGKDIIAQHGFDVACHSARGISFAISMNAVISAVRMVRAFGESIGIIRRLRPDVIVGFGGYGAFPVVCAARVLRCPVLVHEQNVIPGRANKIASRFAKRIMVSFKESVQSFDAKRTIVTGCPCHNRMPAEDRQALLSMFSLSDRYPVIVVLGGSQGSTAINQMFINAIPLLKTDYDIQCIHIAGRHDYDACKDAAEQSGIPYRVFDFYDDIEKIYAIADCAVARAGAVTICELAAFNIPSVLIPYPYAGGHQKENAAVLSRCGCAEVLSERDMTPDTLSACIQKLVEQSRKSDMIKNSDDFLHDAAQRIVCEIKDAVTK